MSDSDIDKLFQFLDKKIIEFRNKEKNNCCGWLECRQFWHCLYGPRRL